MSKFKPLHVGVYKICEAQCGNNLVTWVRRPGLGVVRGFWDKCDVTRRDNALTLAQDLTDGTRQETYHDVYGPAKEWDYDTPLDGAERRVP